MNRTDVYKIIDTERAYQNQKWGGPEYDRYHTMNDWIGFMEDYLAEARNDFGQDRRDYLRIVAALAVAAMESVGAEPREGFPVEHSEYDPCGGIGHIDVLGESFLCTICDARALKNEDNTGDQEQA